MAKQKIYTIQGHITDRSGAALVGLIVRAFDQDPHTPDNPLGLPAVTDTEGYYFISYRDRDFRLGGKESGGADIIIRAYSAGTLLVESAPLRNAGKKVTINLQVSKVPARESRQLQGGVRSADGKAASGVIVQVWQRDLFGEVLLGAAPADSQGLYKVVYYVHTEDQTPPNRNLVIKAYQPDGGLLCETDMVYNVPEDFVYQVRLPQAPAQASEYEQLLADMTPFLGQHQVKDLREETGQEQISFLANKTGWDARVIAMAAAAEEISVETGIPAAHWYAVYRSGVPNDPTAMNQVTPNEVGAIVKKAAEARVIPPVSAAAVDKTVRAHREKAVAFTLQQKVASGYSTMGDLLDLRLNARQKQIFAETYQSHRGNSAAFWSALEQKGLSRETISQLQLDGKLGYLTMQNKPLMVKLWGQEINDPVDLVHRGLYKPGAWKELAGNDIPEGLSADEYAGHLAAVVKRSYPTEVLGAMIRQEEFDLKSTSEIRSETAAFFESNQDKFQIGVKPIKYTAAFQSLSSEAKSVAQRVERLYQISPGDIAMQALAAEGLNSAYDIVQYTRPEFLRQFGDKFDTPDTADSIYTKAHEVHSITLNLTTTYLTRKINPSMYVLRGQDQKATRSATLTYPTLENIFGELDFCTCEHCRSILSPAAYLVDLLRFISLQPAAIESKSNPIDVLVKRRPDIEHIRLNCENTNTVLPYLDLVNEILEYYAVLAASGNLTDWKNYQGYNVEPGSSTEDLLADPAFVDDRAYELTAEAVFPLGLPFDRPLEAMRLLFQLLDLNYDEVLAALNKDEEARREILGLSPKEVSLLTQHDAHPLPEYFGEDASLDLAALNGAIANARVFARRMGLSYDELVEMLKTRFLNPFAAGEDLAKLDQLDISLSNIQEYCEEGMTDADFDALIPSMIDPANYDGDVRQWVKDHRDAIMGMVLLTETKPDPENFNPCSFDTVELRRALPDPANNHLTALDFHKLHRFIRLWKKLAWPIGQIDLALFAFSDTAPDNIRNEADLDAAFTQALARLGHLRHLQRLLQQDDRKISNLLSLWDTRIEAPVRLAQWPKLLHLRKNDFEILTTLAGFDPLLPLEIDDPAAIKFVKAAIQFKAAGLKAVDLDFLLRHSDPGAKLGLATDQQLNALQVVRNALAAVETELGGMSPEADLAYVRTKMGMAYEPAAVDALFSLLDKTTVFEEPLTWPVASLPESVNLPDTILYDHFRKTLSVQGILSQPDLATLQANVNALAIAASLQTQLNAALQALYDAGRDALDALFALYPSLQEAWDAYQTTPESERATALLTALLPALRARLRRQAIEQSLAAAIKTEVATIASVINDQEILHAPDDTALPMITAFDALDHKVSPVMAIDGMFDFYLDVPHSADYNFYVKAPQNTTVNCEIAGEQVINAFITDERGEAGSNKPLTLKTGQLYRISLQIMSLPPDGKAQLYWQTAGAAKMAIPSSRMIDATTVEQAGIALARLQKVTQWQSLLKLIPVELAYLGRIFRINGQGWMNSLLTRSSTNPNDWTALWDISVRLADFALLKKEWNVADDTVLRLLQDPNAINASGENLLEFLTTWNTVELQELLGHFGWSRTDLSDLDKLLSVKAAFDVVIRSGFSARNMLDWTAAPDGNLLREAKDTIRQQVGERAWLEMAPRLTDPLRICQRDALVQWILHAHRPSPEVDTPNKLYEYFLIDVEMDACMKTSRVKQAIATLQLFIQRCLLNLEPEVAPSSIRHEQWEWMKRYRVWEANRKIFLYPENWLEPELRDNKSFLFRELEGELLKADITDDLAESAFLSYLKKLDDIARLDICGMYLEENEKGNQDDDILHVFARSIGEERRYYYRRFEYGNWTPWEKVDAPIKGDHLIPVVWKGRLLVFWLTVFEKGAAPAGNQSMNTMGNNSNWKNNAKVDVEITFSWAEYSKGWWVSPKSGELKNPIRLEGLDHFDVNRLSVFAKKLHGTTTEPKISEKIVFYTIYLQAGAHPHFFTLLFSSKNAPPLIEKGWNYPGPENSVIRFNLLHLPYRSDNDIRFDRVYLQMLGRDLNIAIAQPEDADNSISNGSLLSIHEPEPAGFRLLPLRHPTENQWEAPFFFMDSQRVFSVKPEEEVFPAIWDWQGYYTLDFDRWKYIPQREISPMKEIPGIRQAGLKDPVVNPGELKPDPLAVNTRVLTASTTFRYRTSSIGQYGQGIAADRVLEEMK